MNHALYWFKAVLSKSCFLLPVFIGNNNYIVTNIQDDYIHRKWR